MLQASGLVRRFGSRTLFQIDRLDLHSGECVHLQGINGAGKTTLMKLLAGLDRPDSGSITLAQPPKVLGCPWLGRMFNHWHLRGTVLYLHQRPYLFDSTVRGNIAFALQSSRLSINEKNRRIDDALARMQLSHLADLSARLLSGGEQQRLALARAWVRRPRWLLLDEPCASLDQDSITQLTDQVKWLRDQGCGILFANHQDNALSQLSDRSLLLANGTLN